MHRQAQISEPGLRRIVGVAGLQAIATAKRLGARVEAFDTRPAVEEQVKVLEDGRANWDITYPSVDTVQVEEEQAGSFSFGIDHWEIIDGDVVYDDKSIPFLLSLKGLNHTGSGDFNEKAFDLNTNTSADTLTVVYDGVEYISNKILKGDMTMAMDLENSKFTFKEKHALDTLPARMAQFQADIARLEAVLADPGLYAPDPKSFQSTTSALEAARAKLAAAEEQWLELELLREEIGG